MSIKIATNCRTPYWPALCGAWAAILSLTLGFCLTPTQAATGVDSSLNDKALALGCLGCHGPSEARPGALPALAGKPQAVLIKALDDFASQPEGGGVMARLMRGYSADERRRLAAFFSRQDAR